MCLQSFWQFRQGCARTRLEAKHAGASFEVESNLQDWVNRQRESFKRCVRSRAHHHRNKYQLLFGHNLQAQKPLIGRSLELVPQQQQQQQQLEEVQLPQQVPLQEEHASHHVLQWRDVRRVSIAWKKRNWQTVAELLATGLGNRPKSTPSLELQSRSPLALDHQFYCNNFSSIIQLDSVIQSRSPLTLRPSTLHGQTLHLTARSFALLNEVGRSFFWKKAVAFAMWRGSPNVSYRQTVQGTIEGMRVIHR
eukprot:1157424-Pelagomonas_calceolata.AAC.1